MKSKIPLELKAEAVLELRRRQQERAKDCVACQILTIADEVYAGDPTSPVYQPKPSMRPPCNHTPALEDSLRRGFVGGYGGNSNEIEIEETF